LLLAAGGVTAYLIINGTGDGDAPLPSQVLGTQAIALVNPGAAGPVGWSGTGQAPGTLLDSTGRMTFGADAPAGADWTADQMAGGTYIFIYLANGGLCLTSPPAPASAAVLARCDLQASQRWQRQGLTPGAGGLEYWQFRNEGDGRCLAAGTLVITGGGSGQAAQMGACQEIPGWRQLIAFVQSS
jgi:hypothetical protein